LEDSRYGTKGRKKTRKKKSRWDLKENLYQRQTSRKNPARKKKKKKKLWEKKKAHVEKNPHSAEKKKQTGRGQGRGLRAVGRKVGGKWKRAAKESRPGGQGEGVTVHYY